AAAAAEDRVRGLLQQSAEEAALRSGVEGTRPVAQILRRRPHELCAALSLQRNCPTLRHIQRLVAKEIEDPRRRLSPAAGRAAFRARCQARGTCYRAQGLWRRPRCQE